MKATQNSMRSAKRLRRRMSPPEALLWQLLRRSPAGIRFRRQYAIGPYVADFYCPSAKVVIEVDGGIHNFEPQANHDLRRDEAIKKFGLQVHRIAASAVMKDATAVANAILETCAAARPLPETSSGRIYCHPPQQEPAPSALDCCGHGPTTQTGWVLGAGG